jgi:tRNA 2-selenouridine synthase
MVNVPALVGPIWVLFPFDRISDQIIVWFTTPMIRVEGEECIGGRIFQVEVVFRPQVLLEEQDFYSSVIALSKNSQLSLHSVFMGISTFEINRFLELSQEMPLLDVRSPGEFRKGHIPGAVSFPLFSDEERAVIGTLYKQEGKKVALKKGLDTVGPRMTSYIERAENLGSSHLAMYCWRGGMRSGSLAWLLDKAGYRMHLLEGGYKAYRTQMLLFFDQPLPLFVLTGYTGSKKTLFLKMLEQYGEQVIDLEALACHQGSSFGNRKTTGQPTSEHFQNMVFEASRSFNLAKPVWIEDECLRIGQVTLLDSLFRRMSRSPHIFLEIDKDERIEFLLEEYGTLPVEKLIEATLSISKKLGTERTRLTVEFLKNGRLREAADILLTYYDRYYDKSIDKKKSVIRQKIRCRMQELPELAARLSEQIKYEIPSYGI